MAVCSLNILYVSVLGFRHFEIIYISSVQLHQNLLFDYRRRLYHNFICLFIEDTRFQFWFVCYIHCGNTHFKPSHCQHLLACICSTPFTKQ